MQIKPSLLVQHLQKKIAPMYVLTGQEPYLLNESLLLLQTAIKKNYDCEEQRRSIQSPEEWAYITEEANNYSLFSEVSLLTLSYDKKTMDASGKKVITEFLKTHDERCFVIIRAPHIPVKQLQWLCNHEKAVVVAAYALNELSMKTWIKNKLQSYSLKYDPRVPDLIYNYTQGNMLACAQAIEKMSLSYESNSQINAQQALAQLSDQCVYSLYELTEACLSGHTDKAIHILRQAAENKTEAILVLWMLTQEIRLLLQLSFKLKQNNDFKTACASLKIWPQRVPLYQAGLNRIKSEVLEHLLYCSNLIDEQIKSNLHPHVWNALEKLVLGFGHETVHTF